MELRGFDELRRELLALPETLKRESAPIELAHATAARAEVVAAYPEVTGALRAGVRIVERVAHGVATLYTLVDDGRIRPYFRIRVGPPTAAGDVPTDYRTSASPVDGRGCGHGRSDGANGDRGTGQA